MPPLRPCLDCTRLTSGSRCPSCADKVNRVKNRRQDERRGSSTDRGYDAQHQRERAEWVPIVEAGGVHCRRAASGKCVADSPVIRPDQAWHLGHPDAQCDAPKAPEHVICNSGAPRRKI